MKKRIMILTLCLAMMLSVMSPVAFASPPELTTPIDDPIDPAPFNYIGYIVSNLTITSAGRADCYAMVYVPDESCTIYLYVDLQKKTSSGTWDESNPVASWSASGHDTVSIDQSIYVLKGTYRLAITVDVYTSAGLLGDSVTVHSTSRSYP